MMEWIRRLGNGLFERLLALDPAFSKLYEASKEWLKKDD
jgi:hypothetical protein